MKEYRIVKVIDSTQKELEKREHIIVDEVIRYEVQKKYSFLFHSYWTVNSIHKSIKSAEAEVNKLTEKYINREIVS